LEDLDVDGVLLLKLDLNMERHRMRIGLSRLKKEYWRAISDSFD